MSFPARNHRMTSSDDSDRHYRDLARRTERLTTAMREFETLSLAVSHDFRMPLRFIGTTLRTLAEGRREIDAESRRDVLAMRSALAQVDKMMSDLDELCRAGSQELTLEPVDMEAMVREVWATMPAAQGIAFTLGRLPAALGDRAMLRVVWRHLLGNAVARCADRPNPRVEVTGGGSASFAVYSVHDNGSHLALHFTGKLYHSFEQVQEQSTQPGTGVSLAIVQRLVTRHRGHVWVEASAEKGAFFQFSVGEVQPEDSAGAFPRQ